jgi:hypothetical protein
MYGALEGFLVEHGHWPTKLFIDDEYFDGHMRAAYDGRYDQSSRDLLIALSQKVQILPRPLAEYRAEDNEGRWYDYEQSGFVEGLPAGVLVHVWLIDQKPEPSALGDVLRASLQSVVKALGSNDR